MSAKPSVEKTDKKVDEVAEKMTAADLNGSGGDDSAAAKKKADKKARQKAKKEAEKKSEDGSSKPEKPGNFHCA